MAHLGKGLELVAYLPDTEARLRQEIHLQNAMGVTMMAARGWGAPEVLQAFSKARALCEKLGDKGQLFVALRGEAQYHMISGNLRAADELGRQCLELASAPEIKPCSSRRIICYGATSSSWETMPPPKHHAELGIATYDPARIIP